MCKNYAFRKKHLSVRCSFALHLMYLRFEPGDRARRTARYLGFELDKKKRKKETVIASMNSLSYDERILVRLINFCRRWLPLKIWCSVDTVKCTLYEKWPRVREI